MSRKWANAVRERSPLNIPAFFAGLRPKRVRGGVVQSEATKEEMLTPHTNRGPRLPVARGGFLPWRPRCGGWALYLKLRPARPQLPRDVYGSEGIKRYVSTYRVAFSDLKVTVEVQLAEEDKIVTR
jgi:hypothetical protein